MQAALGIAAGLGGQSLKRDARWLTGRLRAQAATSISAGVTRVTARTQPNRACLRCRLTFDRTGGRSNSSTAIHLSALPYPATAALPATMLPIAAHARRAALPPTRHLRLPPLRAPHARSSLTGVKSLWQHALQTGARSINFALARRRNAALRAETLPRAAPLSRRMPPARGRRRGALFIDVCAAVPLQDAPGRSSLARRALRRRLPRHSLPSAAGAHT